MLTAASKFQKALDNYDGKNGTLAFAIREKLSNGAEVREQPVDALELGMFVRSEVPRLARQKGVQQNANFKTGAGDLEEFPVAEVRGTQQTAGQ